MALGEFELIARYFRRPARRAALGVGDDCALWQTSPGTQLAISSDMLVAGRHFFADTDPQGLGHKALAVNLSDLAACGARPLAFTLALALPEINEPWLAGFSRGLLALADAYDCELIGGDTTRGPLNICITVLGEVPLVNGRGQALLRSGARPSDDIFVSGTLGDARLAMLALQGQIALPADALAQARRRLEQPTPRIALGQALRGLASAALDLSDGLVGDLGHLLQASGVGASLDASALTGLMMTRAELTDAQKLEQVLSGGDDYELLFTAPPSSTTAIQSAARACATPITRIGRIDAETGLRLFDAQSRPLPVAYASFDHFK